MADTLIPQPPTLSGDTDRDLAAMIRWIWDFYRVGVLEGALLQSVQQLGETTIDPASLPKPDSTTLAQAQQTANDAYGFGAAAVVALVGKQAGEFTVSDAATTSLVTLTAEQEDTDYFVVLTPIGETGTPAAASRDIAAVSKTGTGFTVTLGAAPGGGNSITYSFHVLR